MTTYVVNVYVTGYLSEDDDPYTTDDLDDAYNVLADELERSWDNEYDGAENAEERAEIDSRYLDAHTWIHNHPAGPDWIYVQGPSEHSLPMVYGVEVSED